MAIAVWSSTAVADAPTAFERGLERFQANDFAGAIAPLSEAHAASPADPDAALLLAISYYRLGEPDRAQPLFAQAERDGDEDDRASARVFLGLIADARGESARARGYYALVAHSPTELGVSGRMLLERSGPERWSVVAIVQPGYDSNVALQPATASVGPPGVGRDAGDTDVSLIAGGTVRPSLALPLVLEDTLLYRAYGRQHDYDMLGDVIGGTATLAGTDNRASLGYHFDASLLGGSAYQQGHLVDAMARHDFAQLGVAAYYTFADRVYYPATYAGYTGVTHTGVAELASGSQLAIGYVIERAITDDATLSDLGQGARASAVLRPWSTAELHATALVIHRAYDAAAMGRVDLQARADAALYMDVSRAFGLVCGASFVRNASNAADYDYTKWVVFAGVIAAASP
jgi:tetratricopeptide (TPR) repeat protein